MKVRRGWYIIAFVWALAETAYFGWNWFPYRTAEIVADGIGIALLTVALVVNRKP